MSEMQSEQQQQMHPELQQQQQPQQQQYQQNNGQHPSPPQQQQQQQQQNENDLGITTSTNNMINHTNNFPTHHRRSRTRNFENPPQPHMCIKEKTIEGHEIFINVMSWTRIVNPNNAEAPIPLYGGMRVLPANPRSPSLVYAVMASPEVLKKSGRKCSDTPERMYLIDLMCEFVEAMNPGLHLSRKPEILKDRDLSGELKDVWSAVQAIRNKERVENIINTTENLVVYTEFGPRSPSYEQSAMITNQNQTTNQNSAKDPKKFNFDEFFQNHVQQKDNQSAITCNNKNADENLVSLVETFVKKMNLDKTIVTTSTPTAASSTVSTTTTATATATPSSLQPSSPPPIAVAATTATTITASLSPVCNKQTLPDTNTKSDNNISISSSTVIPSSPKLNHSSIGNLLSSPKNDQKQNLSPNKNLNNINSNTSNNNSTNNNNNNHHHSNKKESQSTNFFPKFRSSKNNHNNHNHSNNSDDTNNSSTTNSTTTTTNTKETKDKDNKKGLNFFRRNKSSKNNDNENKIVIQENNKNLDDSGKDIIDASTTSPAQQTTTASVVPLIAK